jgi:hypothetical protein
LDNVSADVLKERARSADMERTGSMPHGAHQRSNNRDDDPNELVCRAACSPELVECGGSALSAPAYREDSARSRLERYNAGRDRTDRAARTKSGISVRAGGHTIGERAHANRVRTALLTTYLVLSIVIGGVALTVPVVMVAAIVSGKGLFAYAPAILPAGAAIGLAIVAYAFADERRRTRGFLEDPGLRAADRSSDLYA